MKKLKILDLFSGIGGFSLGLEATGGFETAAFCDIDPYCRSVLKKHWPNVPIFEDIRKLKGTDIGTVDIITGGYPCQPFSVAGKQKGVEDKRHLWPEYFRLIKECRPTWVIGENVSGHIKLGLDSVIEDLESEGYATRTFSISASSIGANHQRERIWIVANSNNTGNRTPQYDCKQKQSKNKQEWKEHSQYKFSGQSKNVANAYGVNDAIGRVDRTIQETGGSGSIDERGSGTNANGFSQSSKNETLDSTITKSNIIGTQVQTKRQFTTEQMFGSKNSQSWWKTEPNVGRVVNGLPNRVDRLKALGNSLVPQIPFYIGQSIIQTLNVENADTAGQQDRSE
jgi:DNA (cytosine-5)-methyltransferase 1